MTKLNRLHSQLGALFVVRRFGWQAAATSRLPPQGGDSRGGCNKKPEKHREEPWQENRHQKQRKTRNTNSPYCARGRRWGMMKGDSAGDLHGRMEKKGAGFARWPGMDDQGG